VIQLTVIGTPAPQGSKVRNRWGGVREDNPNTMPWRSTVAAVAMEANMTTDGQSRILECGPLITTPVSIDALFVFARPKSHFRTGKNAHLLKETAPTWCATKPDADKLARAVGDALSGVLLRDDNLIVEWRIRKVYGVPERCELRIDAADNNDAADAARKEVA
jgi:Holliday junction resolvase RusA-like endonuclease